MFLIKVRQQSKGDANKYRKLEQIGGFGRYQWLHVTLLGLFTRTAYIWQTTAIVFTGYINNHHCTVPDNITKDEWIPQIVGPDGDLMYDQCHHFSNASSNETVSCKNGWTYEPETFHPTHGTVVMEWDLVCSRSSLVEISIVCLNVGCCAGTFIAGPVGDHYGRRLTYFLSMALLVVSGVATAFSPNITAFCIFSFIRGVSIAGVYTQGIVLGLEIVPKRVIGPASTWCTFMAKFAQILIAFLSYFINHWRYLQLAISLISAPFLFYYRWCPESLHWLHQKGRMAQLEDTLSQIASFNKISTRNTPVTTSENCVEPSVESNSFTTSHPTAVSTVPCQDNWQTINGTGQIDQQQCKISDSCGNDITGISETACETSASTKRSAHTDNSSTTDNLRDFLKRPKLVLYLALSCFLSLVVYSSYFGLVYMQGSLTGSVHLNLTLNSLLGIAGLAMTIFLLQKIGRRPAEALSFSIFGFFMLASAGSEYIDVPGADEGILATVFAMAAKVGEASSTAIFNFFCLEFFPTNIRSTAAGLQTAFGYLGSIIAPFVSLSLIRIAFWIPGVVYGALALLAAASTYLLPETRGRNLPETAAEVEAWPRSLSAEEKLYLKDSRKKERKQEFAYDNSAADKEVESVAKCHKSPFEEALEQDNGNLRISVQF